ncbi:hypothetical protein HN358_01045 [Candidatus Uhrbacteria bacterium]|jgi:hypothetical protein|nr:hypothetical protein [Candidatus Uhrbacteria bacterium]MBT7717470.1 hypothetical protein [Candidatus Uhrbacteria bacterium]
MVIRGERIVETQEDRDIKIYGKHIELAIDFALHKINDERYQVQQAVYSAMQARKIPERAVFNRLRKIVEKRVKEELRDMKISQELANTVAEIENDEMMTDAARLETENTSERDRIDAEAA